MLRRIGIVSGICGMALYAIAALWVYLDNAPDANIGAGLLGLLGMAVGGIGVVLLIIGFIRKK